MELRITKNAIYELMWEKWPTCSGIIDGYSKQPSLLHLSIFATVWRKRFGKWNNAHIHRTKQRTVFDYIHPNQVAYIYIISLWFYTVIFICHELQSCLENNFTKIPGEGFCRATSDVQWNLVANTETVASVQASSHPLCNWSPCKNVHTCMCLYVNFNRKCQDYVCLCYLN